MSQGRVRIIILAQVPPPTHGQSRMVAVLLAGLRRCADLEVHHVQLGLSRSSEEIGRASWRKVIPLLQALGQTLRALCREPGSRVYYVPAPPKPAPLLRDVVLLGVLRLLAVPLVLHWHATGLGGWLALRRQGQKGLFAALMAEGLQGLYGDAQHWALCQATRADLRPLRPPWVDILPNGIPDACPDWPACLEQREARGQARRGQGGMPLRVLFLGSCEASKGLFRALAGLKALVTSRAARNLRSELIWEVAGSFPDAEEQLRFEAACADLPNGLQVRWHRFVAGAEKATLLQDCDVLLFPTYYPFEGHPLVVLESLACGLPVLATAWRGIPEMLADLPQPLPLTDGSAGDIARCLESLLDYEDFAGLRCIYEKRYSEPVFIARAAGLLRQLS